jgi:hypothetical protein
MTMKPIAVVLMFALLAGCMAQPSVGVNGPTGRASDAGKITAIGVPVSWRYALEKPSQNIVAKKLPYGQSAKFDDFVHFDGFYDATLNVTRVAVYGNVATSTDYGTNYNNGYYVTWEQPGRVTGDDLPPWRIVDVEILDEPY